MTAYSEFWQLPAAVKQPCLTEKDAYTLGQIAGQVGIAVDNALAFRQIAELRDRLNQEKRYRQAVKRLAAPRGLYDDRGARPDGRAHWIRYCHR